MKVCKFCNKDFEPTVNSQRYCNKLCKTVTNYQEREISCPI